MGVCVGLGLILTARLTRQFTQSAGNGLSVPTLSGYGYAFIALGAVLTPLSLHMALTWPLTVNPPVNIAFAEPALMLGALLLAAGIALTRGVDSLTNVNISAVRWVIAALGVVMALTASAIWSYDLIGDAPPQEPITGQFTGWENTFFALLYALVAVGCLTTPWYTTQRYTWATHVIYWSWFISGLVFLTFSALNYRTHIGLLINVERGTNHLW